MAQRLVSALQDLTFTSPNSTSNPASSSPNLIDILCQYPICDRLLSHLEISTLLTVKLLSKRLTPNIQSHCQRRWDINRRLKRFVRFPKDLRAVLGSVNALISGSFALQFFDDVTWKESDLDIYLKDNEASISEIVGYLEQREGYMKQAEREPEEGSYMESPVVKVLTFIKGSNDEETKIQLILTYACPVEAILAGFYTTAVVNLLTWNMAYSVFPSVTFLQRKAFLIREFYEEDGEIIENPPQIQKYTDRGFHFAPKKNCIDLWNSSTPRGMPRHVGDVKCWTMTLNTDGVEPKDPVPDYVMRASHFSLHKPQEEFPITDIQCDAFTSPILKYTYTSSSTSWRASQPNFWLKFMQEELDSKIREEVKRIDTENMSPEWWGRIESGAKNLSRTWSRYPAGKGWAFYDYLVPEWMERWDAVQTCSNPTRVEVSCGKKD